MSEKPTTQPKTPTLAELRKMANRKGMAVTDSRGFCVSVGKDHPELTALMVFGCWYRSPEWPDRAATRTDAIRMAFAALSALPDAKGGQPKPGAGEVGK